MDDVYESDHCDHSEDADEYFRNKIEEGAGLTCVSGTGGDKDNFAGFFFTPDISDYTFSNSNPNFIFGNTCTIGNTSHSDCIYGTVLENLITNLDDGVVGAFAPTVGTDEFSVKVSYDVFFNILKNKKIWKVGQLAKEFYTDYFNCDTVHYFPTRNGYRIPFNTNVSDYHAKSMVLYGDPSMPLALYQYKSGNITQNTQWCGSIIVENDISVASGVTLTIQPGTGIFFKDNAQLKVYGALIAEGTEDYPIVFSGASESPARGDWDGIRFEDSSVDANCIVKYCEIEYADYGIYCNYANPTIENNTISNCKYGLYLRYSSPDISANSIRVNQYYGIYGYQSNSYIYDNLIENNSSYGAYFVGSSTPEFYSNSIQYNYSNGVYLYLYCNARFGPASGSGKGNNVIYSNAVYGIRAYYNCYPFMGSSDAYNNRIGGYNGIYGNINYDGYVSGSCGVEAEWNYWDDPQNIYIGSGCSFDITPTLASNDASGSSLAKATGNIMNIASVNPDYERAGFNPRKPNPNRLSDLWLWGHDLFINDKPADAVEVYQVLISKFPNSEEAKRALIIVSQLYSEIGRNDLEGYLNKIIAAKESNNNLKQLACDMLAAHYYQKQDFENAIQCSQSILEQYPDTESEKPALYQMLMTYVNDLKDSENACYYLNELKRKFPNDRLTLMACEEMGEDVDWSLAKDIGMPEQESVAILIPEKYALHNNYPNPFNPMTTIEYDLPEEAKVTLVVYDILGQEIARLADTKAAAGCYQAVWDGKDRSGNQVSSGVYLYSIRTSSGFKATKKMVLVR